MSKPPKPPNLPIVGTQTLSTTSVTTNLARTPSTTMTGVTVPPKFPGINDFASLLSPEIDEDHLPNEVAGSSDVENTNELANPALVHS
ncbi:hypothetical protein H4Q26_012052 [Puccinia striiformis f. sp. tritici PST-130]|nr:hypothetical protein H4Q26_012052 [Puccinia striiformis f. sp. tritici PST-130]